MEYYIAICDDEAPARQALARAAEEWARARGHLARIACHRSAEAFLFSYAEDRRCDILLLDIEMEGMNGVELARAVRAKDKEAQIVFITGYMDYIADGYEVEALHYLVKPVAPEKLAGVLDRAAERLLHKGKRLALATGAGYVQLALYDIRFLEAQRNYVTVHAADGCTHTVRGTLSGLEQQLDGSFYRLGRSYIVNLGHIRRVTKTDVYLSDGAGAVQGRGVYCAGRAHRRPGPGCRIRGVQPDERDCGG